MIEYLIDTSVLLDASYILDKLDGKIIISPYVIEELDSGYIRRDYGDKVNKVLSKLLDNQDRYIVDIHDGQVTKVCVGMDKDKLGNKIIAYGLKKNLVFVTCDLVRALKARGQGLETEIIGGSINTQHKGVKEIYLDLTKGRDRELLERHMSDVQSNLFGLHMNEYLIIYDRSNKQVNDRGELVHGKLDKIGKWTKDGFRYLKRSKEEDKRKRIEALNDLQLCALDLLYDDSVPIKIIAGNFGSGKTYLSLNSALDMVTHKKFDKLICVRNPIGDTDSEDIGFLPGDKGEKIEGFYKCITNNISKDYNITFLKEKGKISYEIPYYMKGMSIEDTFILVEEAEDLTLKTLKLIGSRVSKGSVVCFSGDYQQTESRYLSNNGLLQLISRTVDECLVGCVVLSEDVRSSASKVFANL